MFQLVYCHLVLLVIDTVDAVMKEVDQDALYQSLNEMPVSTELDEENTALQVLIC